MCTAPRVEDLDLTGVDIVAVDLETWDPELKTKGSGAVRGIGKVCGIGVCTGEQTFYFPIRHKNSDKLAPKETWDKLNKVLFQNPNIKKVFHNAMYDVCWIRAETGLMPKGKLLDTMIAASVIDENRMRYTLDSISKDYLTESKYKYDLQTRSLKEHGIKDPMNNMHKLPYSLVKDYAEQDVRLTLKLWKVFEPKLKETLFVNPEGEKKNLEKIFKLETDLFPCLVDMKFKGVRVDVEKAKQFGNELETERDQLIKDIHTGTGIKVEIWASASIKKLLDQQQIKDYKKTPKSGMPQLPKQYLKTHKNVYLRMIARARECDKAKNAFVEGLLSFVHKGRIHADINQIRSDQGGTVTGRFSMSNPNLQQVPAKGPIGKRIREIFIPEDNCSWGSFDYSQQEPRIVVHYALRWELPGTDTLANAYQEDPKTDFHGIVANMAKIPRSQAKTINLGLFYGMGKMKLQKELDLTPQQARDLFYAYHSKVPFIKELSSGLIEFAQEHELIYTLGDRFCRFNRWEPYEKQWNADIGRFEVEVKVEEKKYNEEKEEWQTITSYKYEPVPILTKEEAKLRYKEKYPEDVEYNNFNGHYRLAFTYRALNRLVQGSAADMTKQAMVNLYKEGIVPHIQIHDELCVSIPNQETAFKVKKIMEKAIRLKIPNKVEYASGDNWGDIKK
jgi:DNA polymerase I-like protein with 3'-5' exonuclease and polymerase domains